MTINLCPFTSMLASGFSGSFPGRSLKIRIFGSCMNWPSDTKSRLIYVEPTVNKNNSLIIIGSKLHFGLSLEFLGPKDIPRGKRQSDGRDGSFPRAKQAAHPTHEADPLDEKWSGTPCG